MRGLTAEDVLQNIAETGTSCRKYGRLDADLGRQNIMKSFLLIRQEIYNIGVCMVYVWCMYGVCMVYVWCMVLV